MSEDCCSRGVRKDDHFDLIVVGAGSAGFSAAITAAELGAHVAVIGSGTIGGTCVNVGCVPSKTMIRATEAIHHANTAGRFDGVSAHAEITDWQALVRQKQQLVDELRQAKYLDVLPTYDGIDYLEGEARLVDGGVTLDGEIIRAGKIIIATGSRPAVPAVPGIEDVEVLTSTSALELEHLPASLIVMGGGYIGCELAQMFRRAGVAVTLVTRRSLLADGEPEIGAALTEYFRREGIVVCDHLGYRNIGKTDSGIDLTIEQQDGRRTLSAERLLITAGRLANTQSLHLEAAGVQLNDNGGIRVDEQMRTSKPGVYAAGDVTGRDQFVYMAAFGARIAATNAMSGDHLRYDNSVMPAVVFTDPQVSTVGLTEARARDAGFTVRTSVLPLQHVPRALAARDTRGLIKLIADGDSRRLLGAHIIAPEGADSIQTAAIALSQCLTIDQLAQMIFPYLTTVEGLKLAAQTFDKDVAKLSCCAG